MVREAHRAERDAARRRWSFELPGLGDMLLWGLTATGGLVGSILLYLATVTGRAAMVEIAGMMRNSLLGRAVRGKDPEVALEETIAAKRSVIDRGPCRG